VVLGAWNITVCRLEGVGAEPAKLDFGLNPLIDPAMDGETAPG